MAITYSKNTRSSGDMIVSQGVITCTGVTSGAFDTGLEVIYNGVIQPKSAATGNGVINTLLINTASGGTATNGYAKIGTCTAGDDYHVMFWGR